ncbi:MAG TPA: non-ribosomal peptide synthetase, partial [Acidobacteria bacterium]|nr:non-ribosomal peptide synthetase [Acidobacteriota bacterium]
YVIYTSGSTGRPKGVILPHAAVVRLFTATAPWFGFSSADVWTLFHSYAFDFSVWEIWGALLHGGRLVLVPYWVSREPEAFADLLRAERVTVLNQTPSAFRPLPPAAGAGLRLVIFGGEALDPTWLAPWFAHLGEATPRLVNMYGITETTVHVTYRPITREDARRPVSLIGGPIPDQSLHVLDPHLQVQPVGVPGEICVGGAGLAHGYHGRPELTALRFVPDPFGGRSDEGGARLYRSGDLARRRPDGDVEYLGRIDHQVKIRGFRIELGEIEAAIAALPGVREAVVLARGRGGKIRLVAYVVAKTPGEAAPDEAALRTHLLGTLPAPMVPAAWVFLPSLPLSPSGKVDRKALPEPLAEPVATVWEGASTEAEKALVAIWSEVLGRDGIGIHDNFFALGGDSILGIQILSRASQAGLRLTPLQIFRHPTIAELAVAAERIETAAPEPAAADDAAGDDLDLADSGLSEQDLQKLMGKLFQAE